MVHREKILFWIVLGFSLGIVVVEFFGTGSRIFLIIVLCMCVSVCLFACLPKNKFVIVGFIVVVSASFGFGRGYVDQKLDNGANTLNEFVGSKPQIKAVLLGDQETRDFNNRLEAKVLSVDGRPVERKAKILITTTNPKNFVYGDVVKVKGNLVLPENFYTDTGREFDYVGYLDSSDIHYLVKNASIEKIGHDPPSKILAGLFYVKRMFVGSITRNLPEPQGSLAAGILIDGKQSINGELQEKFRKTGLVHIVVLSGSNVSIVAVAISKAFSFLPRILGMFSACVGIVVFALITGASATVVRASIMAVLVIFSRMSLRKYDPARGLFIASLFMLVHNPAILVHSPSFQLSFLATFAVVKIIPFFETFTAFVPERFGIRDLVVSNIIVQAYLFPVLSWMTGFVSAVSLPVNLLVLPLIPFTMLTSFLMAVTEFLSHTMALPFAFVSQTLLSYELGVVNFFSKFSLAEIPFSGFSTGIVVGFYLLTIIVSLCRK